MKAIVLIAIVAIASSQMIFGGWTEVKDFDRMNDARIDRAIKKLTDYAKKDLNILGDFKLTLQPIALFKRSGVRKNVFKIVYGLYSKELNRLNFNGDVLYEVDVESNGRKSFDFERREKVLIRYDEVSLNSVLFSTVTKHLRNIMEKSGNNLEFIQSIQSFKVENAEFIKVNAQSSSSERANLFVFRINEDESLSQVLSYN